MGPVEAKTSTGKAASCGPPGKTGKTGKTLLSPISTLIHRKREAVQLSGPFLQLPHVIVPQACLAEPSLDDFLSHLRSALRAG